MGGPSPLWGWKGPLFHTQNNTRALRTETSPPTSPVIVYHPLLYSANQLIHNSLPNTSFQLNLPSKQLKHTQHLLHSHISYIQTLISLRSGSKIPNSTIQTPSTTPSPSHINTTIPHLLS